MSIFFKITRLSASAELCKIYLSRPNVIWLESTRNNETFYTYLQRNASTQSSQPVSQKSSGKPVATHGKGDSSVSENVGKLSSSVPNSKLNNDNVANARKGTFPRIANIQTPLTKSKSAVVSSVVTQASTFVNANVLENVSAELDLLDDQVRRWGRLDLEHVQKVLKLIRKKGVVTDQQVLMIIRSFGNIMPKEFPKEKTVHMEKTWKMFEQLGFKFTTAHYNAKLRILLENGEPFEPADVLKEMESNPDLQPNRLTYRLLLTRYCDIGDLEGASKILDYMKSKDMAANESIFNALLKGHMVKNDVAGAYGVLDLMREKGLEPGSEVYRNLLCGFAQLKDFNGLTKTLAEMEKDGIKNNVAQIFDVVFELAQSGQTDKIQKVLSTVKNIEYYNHDSLNCIFRLLVHGHDDAAYIVYTNLQLPRDMDTNVGLGPLRLMIKLGRPLEKVFKFYKDFLKLKRIHVDLDKLRLIGIDSAAPEYCLQLFAVLKNEGLKLDGYNYVPIFRKFAATGNKAGIYETAKSLRENVEKSAHTLYLYAVGPLTKQFGESLDEVFANLKNVGYTDEDIALMKTVLCIEDGKFTEAKETVLNTQWTFEETLLKSRIPIGFTKNPDIEALTQLMKVISERPDLPYRFLAYTHQRILEQCNLDNAVSRQLAISWKKMNLPVFRRTFDRNEEMEIKSSPVERITSAKYLKKSVDELELLRTDLEQRSLNCNSLDKALISKYCLTGDVQNALSLKKKLQSSGFVFSADNLRDLGILAAKYENNLEVALQYKSRIESEYPQSMAHSSLIVNIATLLIKSGKSQDAVKLLNSYTWTHPNSQDYQNIVNDCATLMITLGQSSPEFSLDVATLLFEKGYVSKGTRNVIRELIRTCLEKDDVDRLMSAVEYCCREHQRVPMFSLVLNALVLNEDVEKLQKVVDLTTPVIGEMEVLFHLAGVFIECGKLKQARNILQTPGLRMRTRVISDIAENFVKKNKTRELEHFIQLTKNVFLVDTESLLFYLIRAHAGVNDYKKALDVLVMYEEYSISPSPRTLRYLASVLTKHNQPVPFTVPALTLQEKDADKSMNEKDADKSVNEKDADKSVNEKDADKSANEKDADKGVNEMTKPVNEKRMSAAVSSLELTDLQIAAVQAAKTGNFSRMYGCLQQAEKRLDITGALFLKEVFKQLMNDRNRFSQLVRYLFNRGHAESLWELCPLLPKPFNRIGYEFLLIAYVQSDRADEFMDNLEKNPPLVSNCISHESLTLLCDKKPEFLSKIEQLVENNRDRRSTHRLFNFYVLSKKEEQALEMIKKHGKDLYVMFVCRKAKDDKNEDLIKFLVRSFGDQNCVVNQGICYSFLISMKCEADDWQGALKYLKEAQSSGLTLQNMSSPALNSLEVVLIKNKQQLPWEAGTLDKLVREKKLLKKKREESSSSDESSDDDDDKKGPTVNK